MRKRESDPPSLKRAMARQDHASETGSPDKIRVQDLYEGAWLLCRGFQLKDLTVTGSNGKPIVTFVITGDDVTTTAEEYRSGRATANVALLKFTMEKLKDQMFAKIRSLERDKRKR